MAPEKDGEGIVKKRHREERLLLLPPESTPPPSIACASPISWPAKATKAVPSWLPMLVAPLIV